MIEEFEIEDRRISVYHYPYFFGNSANAFEIRDNGNVIGICWYKSGSDAKSGWYAHSGNRYVGPAGNRSDVISRLLSDLDKFLSDDEFRKTALTNKLIYRREVIVVRPSPMAAMLLPISRPDEMGSLSLWTTVAVGVVQTDLTGRSHAVICPNDGLGLVDYADSIGLIPESRTTLDQEDFEKFISVYSSSTNNVENVRAIAKMIEDKAPKMRFMPKNLIDHIDDGDHFIPRIFLRNDLSEFQALVRIGSARDQQPKRYFFEEMKLVEEDTQFCMSNWYAFRTMDKAVETKMRSSDVQINIYDIENYK